MWLQHVPTIWIGLKRHGLKVFKLYKLEDHSFNVKCLRLEKIIDQTERSSN